MINDVTYDFAVLFCIRLNKNFHFSCAIPPPSPANWISKKGVIQTMSSLTSPVISAAQREVGRGYTDQGQFDITVYDFVVVRSLLDRESNIRHLWWRWSGKAVISFKHSMVSVAWYSSSSESCSLSDSRCRKLEMNHLLILNLLNLFLVFH